MIQGTRIVWSFDLIFSIDFKALLLLRSQEKKADWMPQSTGTHWWEYWAHRWSTRPRLRSYSAPQSYFGSMLRSSLRFRSNTHQARLYFRKEWNCIESSFWINVSRFDLPISSCPTYWNFNNFIKLPFFMHLLEYYLSDCSRYHQLR